MLLDVPVLVAVSQATYIGVSGYHHTTPEKTVVYLGKRVIL